MGAVFAAAMVEGCAFENLGFVWKAAEGSTAALVPKERARIARSIVRASLAINVVYSRSVYCTIEYIR
jgi:hypothetical protein